MDYPDLSEWLTAGTQHSDVVGTAASDGEIGSPLWQIAKLIGIDTDRYFPFHVSFHQEREHVSITMMAADRAAVGNDADSISKHAAENGGTLPVTRFSAFAKFEDLVKCYKRLHIVLRERSFGDVKPYAVKEVELPRS